MPSIKVELPYANMKMEISPLISKLYMRSVQILQVSMSQLTTGLPETASKPSNAPGKGQKSPFFSGTAAIFFTFYDGRYQRTKDGVIDIYEKKANPENTKQP